MKDNDLQTRNLFRGIAEVDYIKDNRKIVPLELNLPIGEVPRIEHFIQAIKRDFNIDVEIRDFVRMEFRPLLGESNYTIRSIRILRTEKDTTYAKVTRI